MAIMRNNDQRTRVLNECNAQSLTHFEIEVIGWLIQHEQERGFFVDGYDGNGFRDLHTTDGWFKGDHSIACARRAPR